MLRLLRFMSRLVSVAEMSNTTVKQPWPLWKLWRLVEGLGQGAGRQHGHRQHGRRQHRHQQLGGAGVVLGEGRVAGTPATWNFAGRLPAECSFMWFFRV